MTGPVEISIPPRWTLPVDAPEGLAALPGRNHPGIGRWLLESYRKDAYLLGGSIVADLFCGGGQLWMERRPCDRVFGCDINAARVDIARRNGLLATAASAEAWSPPCEVDLVAFSPPYPNCDHSAGKTEKQRAMVAERCAHAMQAIEPPPDMLRVFLNIAAWCGASPVAVIARNSIEHQVEVDWVSELEASMLWAGLSVERFFRRIPPGMTEQWKVARGEYSSRTGKTHRVIDREWILVGRVRR